MAINGTHMLFYTSEAEKLRAMLRDVFGFKWVDAHGGWLIFRLPPAEVGVHPAEGPTFDSGVRHQISFMCDDIHQTIAELRGKGVEIVGEPKTESYGITTTLRLPGGCDVMMYQPRHAIAADIPPSPKASARRARTRKKAAKKTAKKKAAKRKAAGPRSASAKKLRRDKRGRRATKAGRRR
jgi:hypothetical protein